MQQRIAGFENNSIRYRLLIQKGKYAYAKCCWKDCPSYLRYHRSDNNQFRLLKAVC